MPNFERAKYNPYEEANMTERRKNINSMTEVEWREAWDDMTSKICRKYGLKRKDA